MSAKLASLLAVLAVFGSLAGCRKDELVKPPNVLPQAEARITMINGQPVDAFVDAGMITVPFDGTPVQVTLDGSMSSDGDGRIVQHRWFSGTSAEAGGRLVPAGEAPDWPPDMATVTVNLPEGEWTFTLWVVDNKGALSAPSTVSLTVGMPVTEPDAGPGEGDGGGEDPIPACVGAVFSGVAEACAMCLCSIDDMCRMAVVESACDESCWGLIQCVGANCPDFVNMAGMGDYSCLMANCMAEYTAATSGATPSGATPAGACARMCPTECAAM